MNPRQRILNILDRKPVDRMPVDIWHTPEVEKRDPPLPGNPGRWTGRIHLQFMPQRSGGYAGGKYPGHD